jgi:arylsulfatase A-like enzyme
MRTILYLFFFSLFSRCLQAQQKNVLPANKPNIIYILADDMGRGMLSYYGQKIVKTPNLDRIARQGVSFNRSYAGVYCAPSRASFITGYSDCRKGKYVLTQAGIYEKVAKGMLTDEVAQQKVDSVIGDEADIIYLPQLFKQAGYITGEVGKLDYGFVTTTKQMKKHGWDYWFGYYDHIQCHGYYPMFLHENGKMIAIPGNTRPDAGKTGEWGSEEEEKERWNMDGKTVYSQDLFLDKIISFIRKNKNQPFFLYYPTQLPHGPVSIPAIHPDFVFNDSLTQIEKEYASMVKKLDDDVGIILNELKQLGIEKNTIIIFSSDNGHEIYYSYKGRVEKPYKNMQTGKGFDNISEKFYSNIGGDVFDGNNGMAGLKRSNWEGGARVPLFISWSGHFKQGIVSEQIVANYDFMATVAELLQVKTKDKKDGVSFLSALKNGKPSMQHDAIAFASPMGPALITNDGWKLRYFAPKKIFQLYYLPKDYKEENDLAGKYPDKVNSLIKLLTEKCDGDLDSGWFNDGKDVKAIR